MSMSSRSCRTQIHHDKQADSYSIIMMTINDELNLIEGSSIEYGYESSLTLFAQHCVMCNSLFALIALH